MVVEENFPLSTILWYQIGGACKYLLETHNKEDVLEALNFIQKNNIKKYLIVGLGSNVLMSDEYYDGAVIHLMREDNKHMKIVEDGHVEIFAGELMDDIIHFCFNNNLIGLEWAGGLPGTIGGAIRGNAGAFGGEIKDNFVSAEVVEVHDNNYSVSIYDHANMDFKYRSSTTKYNKKLIVLSARFKFEKADSAKLEEAKKVYHGHCDYRKTAHPLEYPSCGSTFKNITISEQVQKILEIYPDIKDTVATKWHGKVSMGYIITRMGLKGFTVGNAQASEKHPNFIVNLGGATFMDVYTIIKTIQDKFTQVFGFEPEVEAEIIQ